MVSLSDPSVASASLPPSTAILRLEKTGIVSSLAQLDAGDRATLAVGITRRVHGVFASAKNARSVPWATRDQRDLMVLLELDPSIVSYEDKPERMSLVMDGRSHHHVPAFRVKTRRGDAVIDAFPSLGAQSEGRLRLVRALTDAYADRGVPYAALSGNEIRVEPRFGNARWVLTHRNHQPSQHDELLVIGALSIGSTRTLAQLRNELPGVDVSGVACAMAVEGLVAFGLSALSPEDMSVQLVGGAA